MLLPASLKIRTYTSSEAPFYRVPFLHLACSSKEFRLALSASCTSVTGPSYDFTVWMSTVSNLLDATGIEMPVFAPKVKKGKFT